MVRVRERFSVIGMVMVIIRVRTRVEISLGVELAALYPCQKKGALTD